METVRHAIHWFEIPVEDFERARAFYSKIFDFDMPAGDMGPNRMGFFPCDRGGIGGAIVRGPGYTPSATGSKVYLNGGADLAVVLGRVEAAGGTVVLGKTLVREDLGWFAVFRDPDGNEVALHSMA